MDFANVNNGKPDFTARERIISVLDVNSFVELSALSKCGVVAGYGATEGRLVYIYCQYGAVNAAHADKISRLYDAAAKMGAPVVGILDSDGIELSDGLDALDAYGKIFKCMSECSGVVPQICVVSGKCIGTAAFIAALSDFVIMPEKGAALLLNSPATLSGADARTAMSAVPIDGLVHFAAKTEQQAFALAKQLLEFIPSNNLDEAPIGMFSDDLNRTDENIAGADIYTIIKSIADSNIFLESFSSYAEQMITGFVRLNGCSVGVVANNGALTVNAMEKAVSFINFCDAFSIPLLSLTCASAYEYNLSEQRDVLKNGAKLVYSFAQATVPKVNIIIGDSTASPYLFMNSKHIGADVSYAWSGANVSIANPQAAEIIAGVSVDGSPAVAAQGGHIDDIIEPPVTRKRVISAFEMLNSKRVVRHAKKHGSVII